MSMNNRTKTVYNSSMFLTKISATAVILASYAESAEREGLDTVLTDSCNLLKNKDCYNERIG